MTQKGIIVEVLCTNPDCPYSQEKLQIKQALTVAVSSGVHSFKVPKACPRCKSPTEMLGFVSGTVEITADKKD